MKKKIFALLAAMCIFTACAGGNNAGGSTAADTSVQAAAGAETTAPADTEATDLTIDEAAFTAKVMDYTIHYAADENEELTEEQRKLYDFYCSKRNDDDMKSGIESIRAQVFIMDMEDKFMSDDYEIYDDKYYADFDGDGDLELYVYRNSDLYPKSQWTCYRDLWYTDGELCTMLYTSIGFEKYAGILEPDGGLPVFFAVNEVVGGASSITAQGYVVSDGTAELYEHPAGEYFIYESGNIFIYKSEFDFQTFEKALIDWKWSTDENKGDFQTLGWVGGKIGIIAGYGADSEE